MIELDGSQFHDYNFHNTSLTSAKLHSNDPCNSPQATTPSNTNLQNIGSNPNAKRMAEVVSFYKKLPTGPAPAAKKSFSPWGKYRAAYIDGDNASGKPLLHLAIFIIVAGYTWEYQAHLKHHKDH